ncbi:organic hydroperoxide resistance protein [Pusillimonas noertemannii]|uniref:Ohr subfamily peroxiredoxin n=1 Tax=Pusillimonas noertemannii TaxID=305977 RepID=A0A2U1CN14_9BURK|nr:organic hydroperoxide resistance protein [Pusillimonas noertemannii]NYT68583.1 organic hydroperoxide resistance protein [Pusillimonas noertemannii]PVY62400.1 Ohr subfamily peroxiredoxin [Pusillimonas noertemannii]TFL10636.1 organic hydroperoxide resistance protein [Pusillimonas noertemannii]
MKVLYTAVATATGGRQGHAQSEDGSFSAKLARPVEIGGPGGGTNPEELFACGYAACFASTLDHLAKLRKIELGEVKVKAWVSLGVGPDGKYGLQARLQAALPDLPRDKAEELLSATHNTCPYSAAIRGNVEVEVSLAP